MKKFTEKILINQLEAKKEEVEIIMQFQKDFPIFTQIEDDFDNEMFLVNARDLHSQIVYGVNSKEIKGTKFSKWIKRRIEKYGFKELEDFTIEVKVDCDVNYSQLELKTMSAQQKNRLNITEEYKLSLDMAKQLCMIENNDRGKNARHYFITMEKMIKRKLKWEEARVLAKRNYKPLCIECIKYFKNVLKKDLELSKTSIYLANAVNICALGKTAKEIKKELELVDNKTRDNLIKEQNKRLDVAQNAFMSCFKLEVPNDKIWEYVFSEVEEKFGIDNRKFLSKINRYNYLLY